MLENADYGVSNGVSLEGEVADWLEEKKCLEKYPIIWEPGYFMSLKVLHKEVRPNQGTFQRTSN